MTTNNGTTWIGDTVDNTLTYQPQTQQVKRVTRTIEKYDSEQNLISREVIVEEEDYYDKQVFPSHDIIITDYDTTEYDTPYTLTNGMNVGLLSFVE